MVTGRQELEDHVKAFSSKRFNMPRVDLKNVGEAYPWTMVVRKFLTAAVLILGVVLFGTFGYAWLESWTLFDSLYMTVITIATVGFSEVQKLDHSGRVLTIVLIFLGIGVGGYAVATITAFLVEGTLLDVVKGRRMVKELTGLKNHIIVCGYGKIGVEVCHCLAVAGKDFIVIDTDADKIDAALSLGYIAAVGEATDDDILLKCGIRRAAGLISAVSDDTANVYLILTARALNDKMYIISRGVGETSHKKMLRAGANRVVSPYEIGARRMAALMLTPDIVDFLEAFSPANEYGLRLERVSLKGHCRLDGLRLDESFIKRDTSGAMVLGIQKPGQSMLINPPGSALLQEDDVLMVIGANDQIEIVKKMAGMK
jgi:voltage-gated potassium channel